MLRSLGDDLAKLSLIDIAGWNLHDTIISPAVASRELPLHRLKDRHLSAQPPRLYFGNSLQTSVSEPQNSTHLA